MSIKTSRNNKTFITDREIGRGDFDPTSMSVIGSAHVKHIFGMWFFKSQEWNKKLTQISKKITGKFNSIKVSSWRFFSIDSFNSTKSFNQSINKIFINAMYLKFKHVVVITTGCFNRSLRDKETTISIDQPSKVNQIISRSFLCVKKFAAITHKFSWLSDAVSVIKSRINVHRDRLSEWTPQGEAIVGPA